VRLSFADAGLPALDALTDIDAVCLFLPEDQRPLRGLAGYLDWRLCGGLSRILKEGRFVGALSDALLFPTSGRLGCARVFCFGVGKRAELSAASFGRLVKKACESMTLAGSRAFATELPEVSGVAPEDWARAFLAEGATRFKGERIVLMGEGRELARVFGQVAGQMKGLESDKEPLGAPALITTSRPASAAPVAPKVKTVPPPGGNRGKMARLK